MSDFGAMLTGSNLGMSILTFGCGMLGGFILGLAIWRQDAVAWKNLLKDKEAARKRGGDFINNWDK